MVLCAHKFGRLYYVHGGVMVVCLGIDHCLDFFFFWFFFFFQAEDGIRDC